MTQQHPPIPSSVSMLRRGRVQMRTGFSRSTLYRRVAEGTFPQPVNLGGRTVGWVESEIQDWLERQIAASRVKPETDELATRDPVIGRAKRAQP